MGAAGARQVDQRPREAERRLPASPAAGRPDASLGQPARRRAGPRRARKRPGPLPRAGADRHPPPRRPQHGGERRLPRGLVSASCAQYPGGVCQDGLLLSHLPGPGPGQASSGLDARKRGLPIRERPARDDDVVPRPHARDDARQRLRRAGRLLPDARRTGRRGRWDAPRPGAGARRSAGPRLLRDPDRNPGPLLQRRRLVVLSRQPRLLRGPRPVPAADPVHARPGLRRAERRRANLEPRVLRQRDRRQRRHLARARGPAAALPLPPSERLRLALPDPADGQRPAVLADRQ